MKQLGLYREKRVLHSCRAMPKQCHKDGLHTMVLPECSFREWLEAENEAWYSSDTAFQTYIIHRRVLSSDGDLVPLPVRAIAIFMKHGVAMQVKKCVKCGGPSRFECRTSRGWTTYGWTCRAVGHKHMEIQVNKYGFLTEIPINSWLPFLQMVNMFRLGKNFGSIVEEIQAGHGNIDAKTIRKWRNVYQQALGSSLDYTKARVIGGKNMTVVLDEAVVGVHPEDGWSGETRGVNKAGAQQTRTGKRKEISNLVEKGVMKKLPGRTLHAAEKSTSASPLLVNKKPASRKITKKPASSVMKKPSSRLPPAKRPKIKNLKASGLWLWLGVCVGEKKKVFTHKNRLKKITYRLMPSARRAVKGKPRGFDEIQATVQSKVAKGSFLIFDGWLATEKAVKSLGYRYAPPVKHEKHFRDPNTGFHTNDAESENSRLKRWSRQRYGKLQLNEHELDEYVFYVNVATSAHGVLHGLAMSNGGVCKNDLLALY